MMENNRNYFIAIALSVLIVLAWQFFYMNPRLEAQRQAEQAAKLQQQTQQAQTAQSTQGGTTASGGQTPNIESRDEAVANSPRVTIDTPALTGSIRLAGARLDDLKLKGYHETVDKSSPIITLFSPGDTKDGYFTEFGYIGDGSIGSLPGPSTVWTLASGDKLTEKTPVTLTYTNDKGIVFSRTISVDDRYMFTVTDKITNSGQTPVALSSYGRLTRNNKPATPSTWLQHEGFLGLLGASNASSISLGNGVTQEKYTAVDEKPFTKEGAVGGWFG
ncbi:MAG: membrane protein insertase YidC, partial [Rhizobiaceae bacterium]|nr:membrane protein insertase YidC [Rhizobiaceae bacterium]